MQMSQIVQTFRLCLIGMANVLTCIQTCVDCRIVKTKPHRRVWKSLLMEIAKRRMNVVTEKSAYIPDTPLLHSSATVQA